MELLIIISILNNYIKFQTCEQESSKYDFINNNQIKLHMYDQFC